MKKIYLGLLLFFAIIFPVFAKDKSRQPNYIYDELLNANNYEITDYNYPAGKRELNLFGLKTVGQFNLNAVAAPDFEYLVYSEVYFYPDSRVTASALYLVPLPNGFSNKEAILSVSTKDKIQQPLIETNYAKLYPMKFNTFTPIDWSSTSNKILFKEKIGENYNTVFKTNLFVYDLQQEKLFDLNILRNTIINYWAKKNLYLEDYKWDIVPLGFLKNNENQIIVKAYGYYKDKKKFLGTWTVDTMGKKAYLYIMDEQEQIPISANGKCLKFIPDMEDIYAKQRRIDAKKFQIYIEPK